MTLTLHRRPSQSWGTPGLLSIDGEPECFTLEDVVRSGPKVVHETAIPAGRYRVVITRSQRFQKMLPLLLNVPGFEGVRMHAGNTSADTSGCPLVCLGRFERGVTRSREAMDRLQPQIAAALARGDDVQIEVVNG